MEKEELIGKTREFIVPSGASVTIMEQNGEHDDILSHPGDARTLMNISKFIAAIVINTSLTKSGRLTPMEAHNLPTLDRYCILINSRIHSLGQILEMSYDWPIEQGGPKEYEVDLDEYLLSDYSKSVEELQPELLEKPNAIPLYIMPERELTFELSSGKKVSWKLLTGEAESRLVNLPENEKTKNSELLVRDLKLEVDGVMMKVQRFHLFSPRDMAEIRAQVRKYDPPFFGRTDLENPVTQQVVPINIMGVTDFFYLGEM